MSLPSPFDFSDNDPAGRLIAQYNAKRQSRGLRSIDGSPLVNLESNIDQVGGPVSEAAAPGGGGGSGGISVNTLQTQVNSILARLAAASGTLSATCSGGGVTGTITITI